MRWHPDGHTLLTREEEECWVAEDDQLIAGRYRLSAQVGSGAMGVVWRAEDERLRRTVALKQVRLPSGVDDQTRDRAHRRVMREGRLFARVHHPHAIAVFDVVDHADQPWLVMEYLPSQSLSEVVTDHGVLTPPAAASVGHQVAAALTAAHTAGIVHRDVKPGNVLLGHDGLVKVTDFGISRAIDETTITTSGMVAGTPSYLAPEVARGAEADFRSDVYSLGSTIYAAVEGEPPFGQGDNALAQLHRVATGEYTPPRRAGSLTSLLERLLADDPARRPEMHQVRDELGRLAAVEAETDEWAENWPEPTGPTLPVTPPRTDVTGPRSASGGSPGSAGDGAARSRPGIVPLAAAGAAPEAAIGSADGAARPAGTSPGQPSDGAPGRVAIDGIAAPAPRQPTAPGSTLPVPSGAAPGATTSWPTDEQDRSEEAGSPRRRRGLLLGLGLAVLLIGALLALVLGTTNSNSSGPASSAAGRPGTTGTDQASSSGDGSASGAGSASGDGSTTGGGSSAAPVAPVQGTPDQVAEQQAIIDYYSLIPSNLQEGWQRLTPTYQRNTAGGFAGYTRFWGTMRQSSVRGVSPGAGDTVDATVIYVYEGGRTSQERTLFTMVQQDGTWKIDGSQVLSSR
jgi:eukaryotic-like serine/threonine-protein kinase